MDRFGRFDFLRVVAWLTVAAVPLAAASARPAGARPADAKEPAAAPVAGLSASFPPAAGLQELRDRRKGLAEKLRKHLGKGRLGVFLWKSGGAADPEADYRPDRDFYYLTGHDEAGAAVVLSFSDDSYSEALFLPPRNASQERWTGRRHGPGRIDPDSGEPDAERRAALERTGFESVRSMDRLDDALDRWLRRTEKLWLPYETGGINRPPSENQAYMSTIRSRFPDLLLKDPRNVLSRLRYVKSATELALIEKAVEITCEAHNAAMRDVRSASAEYFLHGLIEGSFLKQGASGPAFSSIVGSGANGTVLHYRANRGPVRPGDLIVIDIGAEVGYYAADVTRTIPASGRLTSRQREIYELVLKAQTAAAAEIRPGATINSVHAKAVEVFDEAGYRKQFLHGTSHFLGLDVHDNSTTDGSARNWKFEPGVVLTVEPGLYFPDEALGVRIEDDYVVTRSGSRRISDCSPSEPAAMGRLIGTR